MGVCGGGGRGRGLDMIGLKGDNLCRQRLPTQFETFQKRWLHLKERNYFI